jgi:hypothetical protein
MRPIAITAVALFVIITPVSAGEKEMLDKFKKQNQQGRDKIAAYIKEALDKAELLEKDSPARALGLLQDTRERMLEKGLLSSREDRALADPLWERIMALRLGMYNKKRGELRGAVIEYKDYLAKMRDQLTHLRTDLIPPTKEAPPGEPAFFMLVNGKQAVGWLHERPYYTVHATINDEYKTYGPGTIAGMQVRDGYYLYRPDLKRFRHISNGEFVVVAIYAYPASRNTGFWYPEREPPPPPGFDRSSIGVVGMSLFARSAGALLSIWSSPAGQLPEDGFAPQFGGGKDAARVYRDVLVDLQVQEVFPKLNREDLDRCRDIMIGFLDRRLNDEPLVAGEIERFAESIAEVLPERRDQAVTFAHRVNRVLVEYKAQKKQ